MSHLQWHPRIHRAWAREQLFFWRLGFYPTYRHDDVLTAIEELLEQHRVLSATCYELIGVHDILLRVWLPDSSSQEEFERDMIDALAEHDLKLCEVFVVSRPVRLWPWNDGEGGLREPDEQWLQSPLSDEELRAVQSDDASPETLDSYRKANVMADAEHSPGVKFFVVVTAGLGQSTLHARRRLEDKLASILDDAPEFFIERSMYSGTGFGQFLLIAKAPLARLHEIASGLVDDINNEQLQGDYAARTYTHLAARSEYRIRQEKLPYSEQAVTDLAVEAYLATDESETLEVKGSVFLDVYRWINDGTLNWDDRRVSGQVLKTIVAFLNTRGGRVIVGALEAKRFGPEVAALLGHPPQLFGYICLGLNVDYKDGGWDEYERRLRDLIGSNIRPDPGNHVRIERRQLVGKDMCVITVGELSPTPGRPFFYLRDGGRDQRFFVRRGSETHELAGIDADEYKREVMPK